MLQGNRIKNRNVSCVENSFGEYNAWLLFSVGVAEDSPAFFRVSNELNHGVMLLQNGAT